MPSRRRLLAGVATGSLAVAAGGRGASSPSAPDWPMARYDPAGTAHAPDASGPVDEPRVAWRREVGSVRTEDVPQPILVDGTVYATGGGLAAVEAGTGDRLFRADGDHRSPPATVAARPYRSDTIVATGPEGVFGVAASGGLDLFGHRLGAERWATTDAVSRSSVLGPPEPTTPVAVDGTVYVVVPGTNELAAIEGGSGRVRWRYDHGDPIYRPAIRDGVAYLTSWAGPTVAVDLGTGTELWTHAHDDADMRLAPTATAAGLVVPTRSDVRLLDVEDRTEHWRVEYDEILDTEATAAVADGLVVIDVGRGEADLVAIDLESGEERWSRSAYLAGSPVVADGTVFVPAAGGRELHAYALDDGDTRWQYDPWTDFETSSIGGLSTPVVGDGRLYVRTRDALLALEGPT